MVNFRTFLGYCGKAKADMHLLFVFEFRQSMQYNLQASSNLNCDRTSWDKMLGSNLLTVFDTSTLVSR